MTIAFQQIGATPLASKCFHAYFYHNSDIFLLDTLQVKKDVTSKLSKIQYSLYYWNLESTGKGNNA